MATDPNCIFCKIVAGQIPAKKIYEDADLIAIRDINPAAPTHILVVPRKHIARLTDCAEADAALLGRLQFAAGRIAAQEKLEWFRTGYNCGEGAGQSVWHIHLHLLGGRTLGWPPG